MKASNPGFGDNYGSAVAVSGDTAAIGLSPGAYRATVSLAGAPAARYFLRIER